MTSLLRAKGGNWRSISRHLTQTFIEIVLPPVCAGCGSVGHQFCDECQATVAWVVEPVCRRCGRPEISTASLCASCSLTPPPLELIRAATHHAKPVRKILHKMKYQGYFALARPLGELMVAAWPRWEHELDLVVPIPLHSQRKRERGYNQSELLSDVLEQELDLPSRPPALNRSRHTRPQLGLTANERRANVLDAFSANRAIVQGKRIMLVDDVFTTGSTLTAAAEALYQAGARSVTAYCLTTAAQITDDEADLQ